MNEGHAAIIIGTVAFIYGLYCLFRMFAFRKWESTEGKILSSSKSTRRENFQKFEDAEITYEYEVNGKTYRSSVIKASGDMSGDAKKKEASDVDKLIAKYPAGSTATVYYNPSIPKMACLEQGGGEAMFICLVFGPIAVAVGYFFLL
jgi:hypothetical protein